jgi:hypothetical protein
LLSFGAESFVFQVAIEKYNFKIYKIIILPVVLYGFATWSLTLRKERRLRAFENRALRRILGLKRDEVTGSAENYIMSSLMISSPTKYFSVDQIEKNEMGEACSTYGGEKRRTQGFGGVNLRERGHLENKVVDGRIILRWILRKWDGGA